MAPNWLLVDAVPAKYLDGRDMLVVQMPGGRQLVARWAADEGAWTTTFGHVTPTHVLPLDALPPTDPPVATQLPFEPPLRARSRPIVTALTPATAALGDPDFTLHVYGRGFDVDAVILWNGAPEATTRVSATELTTGVNMATAEVAMPIPVAVQDGDGSLSNTLMFTLAEPA
jgi:hypothetical protein